MYVRRGRQLIIYKPLRWPSPGWLNDGEAFGALKWPIIAVDGHIE
jgi:hypothetical protein